MYETINVYDALDICHFYWASNLNALPPEDVRYNLHLWSEHLKNTHFIPLLWVNQSVYDAILSGEPSPHAGLDISIPRIYSCARLPYLAFPQESNFSEHRKIVLSRVKQVVGKAFFDDPKKICYWHIEINNFSDHTRTQRIGVWVINVEQFFSSAAFSQVSSLPVSFKHPLLCTLANFYRELNTLGLIEWTKDCFCDLILYLFGGFYFDCDIKPCLPFFESMKAIKSQIDFYKLDILYHFSLVTSQTSHIFSLRKLNPIHHAIVLGSQGKNKDVGMLLSLIRFSNFFEPKKDDLTNLEEYVGKFQEKKESLLTHLRIQREQTLVRFLKQIPLTKEGDPDGLLPRLTAAYSTSGETLHLELIRMSTQYKKLYMEVDDEQNKPFNELLDQFQSGISALTYFTEGTHALNPESYSRVLSDEKIDKIGAAYLFFYSKELAHRFSQISQETIANSIQMGYSYIEKLYFLTKQMREKIFLKKHFRFSTVSEQDVVVGEALSSSSLIERVALQRAISILDATIHLVQRGQFPWLGTIKTITERRNQIIVHQAIALSNLPYYEHYRQQLSIQLQRCHPVLRTFSIEGVSPECLLGLLYGWQDHLNHIYDEKNWKYILEKQNIELALIAEFFLRKFPRKIVPLMQTLQVFYDPSSRDIKPSITFNYTISVENLPQYGFTLMQYQDTVRDYIINHYNVVALEKKRGFSLGTFMVQLFKKP